MAGLVDSLMRLQRRVRGRRTVPDPQWLDFLLENSIWPGPFRMGADGRLALPLLGIEIDFAHRYLAQVYEAMLRAVSHSDLKVTGSSPDPILASIGGVQVNLTEGVDFFSVEEIYIEQAYGCTLSPGTIVVDIGMNIGVASLWFASMPNVEKVYGFEPFTPTYERSLANFALNPTLQPKIEPANFGLDRVDGQMVLDYNPTISTAVGIYATVPAPPAARMERISVQMKEAASVIAAIRDRHPTNPLFLKIDVEGSEFDILPNLADSGQLQGISGLVIETHRADIRPMLDILSPRFPRLFYHYRVPPEVAMIYAGRE